MRKRAGSALTPLQFLMRRSGITPTPRPIPRKLSSEKIRVLLHVGKLARKKIQRERRAARAVKVFRPKKSEIDSLVMISSRGKRLPPGKNRNGYLVYVGRKKSKKLVIDRRDKNGPRLRSARATEIPWLKKFRRSAKKFEAQRAEIVGRGRRPRLAGGLKGKISFGPYSQAVQILTGALAKVMRGQAADRSFNLSVILKVQLPDGETKPYFISVAIDRPDHILIREEGLKNFIRRKFYNALAARLGFDGLVTRGSANHIRRLPANQNIPRELWTDNRDNRWEANEMSPVTILGMEWKIEQNV